MEIGINQLFEMLSSDSPVEIQNRGIEEAENIKYLSIFFQPVEDKGVWENCAKVVSKKTDAVLKDYLIWMFEWLQDANWPGFFVIYDRIKQMDAEFVLPAYIYTINKAMRSEDENWLDYLAGIAENPKIFAGLPVEYQMLMKKHYKNFWG